MDDIVDIVSRRVMRCRLRRFKASTLINRDIDQHCARLHQTQHLARHQMRRARARDQDSADHNVGIVQALFNRRCGGIARGDTAMEHVIKLADARQRAVKNLDPRAHPCGNPCRLRAHDPAAKHDDFRRQHSGHAAHQSTAPAIVCAKGLRAGLD